MRIARSAVVVVLMLSSAAVANPVTPAAAPGARPAARDPAKMVTDDCALARRAGKTCVLQVPPEDVGGQTPSAGDVRVAALAFGWKPSLLRLRSDFLIEIVRAAEDL